MKSFIAIVSLLLAASTIHAGRARQEYVDGCQTRDGRFRVTAELVGANPKDPNAGQWKFHWKDTKTGHTHTGDLVGLPPVGPFVHLFIAPDGETFAAWNPFSYSPSKTNVDDKLSNGGKFAGGPNKEWADHPAVAHRLVIYRKTGDIVKSLGVKDLLNADELKQVYNVFHTVRFVSEYPGLAFSGAPRVAYGTYRISPNYTVLEFQAPRTSKEKAPRIGRLDLKTGTLMDPGGKLEEASRPIRPFLGPDRITQDEQYRWQPGLDPVREEGKLTHRAPFPPATLALVKGGFKKLDTPAWVPSEKCLAFTDLDAGKLYRLDGDRVTPWRNAGRGRVGPDGRWYGVSGGILAAWKPGSEPQAVAKASGDTELSLNDLAITSSGRLYFTTLKDPEKGRVTVVNLETGAATVCYDAEKHPELSNPNGIAVSPDGKALFVAVSNYKDRKRAGIYRFTLASDGIFDPAEGKKARWAAPAAPDGLAFGPDGRLYCTDGNLVRAYGADSKETGTIKIPQDSGTNLTFGSPDGRTLFVTTNRALFSGRLQEQK